MERRWDVVARVVGRGRGGEVEGRAAHRMVGNGETLGESTRLSQICENFPGH